MWVTVQTLADKTFKTHYTHEGKAGRLIGPLITAIETVSLGQSARVEVTELKSRESRGTWVRGDSDPESSLSFNQGEWRATDCLY